MYIDIHTHNKSINTSNTLSVYNLNVPDYHCRCGLDLQNTNYSLGIHPWNIKEQLLSEHLRYIEDNATFDCVKAIGECGLDKLTKTDWDLQVKALQAQIIISEKVNKPLIIHCVKAFDELITLKKELKPKQTWIIHGFRGKPEQMHQLINLNFCLSFGKHFNEDTIKTIPLDRLFLETDNNNSSICQIYRDITALINISEEELIIQLEKNFAQRFN
ncbi:TatD DNase family protein [Dysgonomonadaceae bacterium PH5-43]|nr:TatD DNase family protein [Dysgonomonadaceae bacterium PH5-43]